MIFRFSLYGFLKNQRYFEAFLVLAFIEKGLNFFEIGLLVAVRELAVNLLEIPSGAIADIYGRRLVMIGAFVCYVVSFLVLGLAEHISLLFVGMFLFGVGDAFRTGTHKAMIFAWLRLHDRTDERVRIYGYTRSWSKIGSAVSVLIAAVIVLLSGRYTEIFFIAIVPYGLAIINFMGYPKELDARAEKPPSLGAAFAHMVESIRVTLREKRMRRLVMESMGFDAVFDSVKDYLQPVLATAAVSAAAMLTVASVDEWSDTRKTALLVGPVYFVLHLLASAASRNAHRASDAAGGEERAARRLWAIVTVLYASLALTGWFDAYAGLIVGFVLLHVVHNLWRPILISRFDRHGPETHGASLLSIENQGRRASTMIIAPVLGLAIDAVAHRAGDFGGVGGGIYWPIGALGLVISVVMLVTANRSADRAGA